MVNRPNRKIEQRERGSRIDRAGVNWKRESTVSPLEGNGVLVQISELQATNIPPVTISRLCER